MYNKERRWFLNFFPLFYLATWIDLVYIEMNWFYVGWKRIPLLRSFLSWNPQYIRSFQRNWFQNVLMYLFSEFLKKIKTINGIFDLLVNVSKRRYVTVNKVYRVSFFTNLIWFLRVCTWWPPNNYYKMIHITSYVIILERQEATN